MDKSLKLKLLRNIFAKESQEGFSLIELVVVVSVLAVLASIGIPTFNCFQRKAQATTALAAMKQIQTECQINKSNTGNTDTFTSSNLNSYQIQSDGSNSCS
ncbi:prepilin-type N-terminal cleavage/methylation domain-containing protein [Prochlorococcus marinus]|uniref:prepilin-type N-terminal cleavage/methylation domain-containing protein n=1 Tax=Prochlorococcus marinus TaxID=1219 RepID=UPI0022B4C775|nr:prepilin-type N-terminal cleavage/methylation domain-containing protein [Prochlorococcus marinus]